jgi:hypothetical protein
VAEYDDERQIAYVITTYRRDLLSDDEKTALTALFMQAKGRMTDSEAMRRMIAKHWVSLDDARVRAALARGLDGFRLDVSDASVGRREHVIVLRCITGSRASRCRRRRRTAGRSR